MRIAALEKEYLLFFRDDDAYADLWSLYLCMGDAPVRGLLWQ